MDTETITLLYEDVDCVTRNEFLTYGFTLRAGDTEYEFVNVTPDGDSINSMIDEIRRRARLGSDHPDDNNGVSTAASSSGTPGEPSNAAEELEQGADRFERGVVPEAEFEQKKQDLL